MPVCFGSRIARGYNLSRSQEIEERLLRAEGSEQATKRIEADNFELPKFRHPPMVWKDEGFEIPPLNPDCVAKARGASARCTKSP